MELLLALFEGKTFYFNWEVDLIAWLQQVSGSIIVTIMQIISMFGEELIIVGILGVLYWGIDKEMGEYIGFNLMTVNILNPLSKNIALRRRPYMDNPERIRCLKLIDSSASEMDIVKQGYSFPSGHSSGASTMYPSIAFYRNNRKHAWLVVLAVVIPFLVGLSRVWLGVHYPTDVIAGWALGIATILLISSLRTIIKNKYWIYIGMLVIGAVGMFYCKSNDYFTSYGMAVGFTAGVFFEERVVKFKNTRIWWRVIIRLILGGAIYLGLNELIKLPAPAEFLESATAGQFAFRTVRYAIIIFLVIGVYPMLFRLGDKLFLKWKWIKPGVTPPTYLRPSIEHVKSNYLGQYSALEGNTDGNSQQSQPVTKE
ncbi:MAG: phosphatase PAP2 family protein [Clostridia bacterium]|nr:phosphatase PAP2 family protein [Clostridia bacterium]